jgi:hypothetical protein
MEFKQSLWMPQVRENPEEAVFRGPRYNEKLLIEGLSSGGGRVFFLDRRSGTVFCYDPATGETDTAFSADFSGYHLAVREDGGTALVSSYRYKSVTGFLANAVVTEYNTRGGRTGRKWEGLYYADYFRDGVIGVSSSGHRNNLVFRPGNGREKETEEVLLRGTEELLYSNPAALDDHRIVFIAAKRGKRELCLYNYESREVYTITSDIEDDAEYWRYMRGLRVSGGRVLFSYNHDGRMYKLGMATIYDSAGNDSSAVAEGAAEGAAESIAGSVVFAEEDFSGGVFLPVEAGGRFYYRGAFSPWDRLMRYPNGAGDAVAGTESTGGAPTASAPTGVAPVGAAEGRYADLRLEPWEEAYRAAALPERDGAPGEPPDDAPSESAPLESKRYIGLAYLNPLKLWLPFPLIRQNNLPGGTSPLSVDGVGIFSYMADPIENNQIFLFAFFDIRSRIGVFNVQWRNYAFGFPLILTFSDDLDKTTARSSRMFRDTRAAISATLRTGLGGESLRLAVIPQAQVEFVAPDPRNNSNPYSWKYQKPIFSLSTRAEISTIRKLGGELFGSGLSLAVQGMQALQSRTRYRPRFEGKVQASFEPRFFPLRLRLYGIWDDNLMKISGASSAYSSSFLSDMTASEYLTAVPGSLKWLAGGEAEVGIFSLDIQNNISHLYFNRITGTLAYRGAFYQDVLSRMPEGNSVGANFRLTQSLVARLSLTLSTAIVPLQPFGFAFTGFGIWKISGLQDSSIAGDIGFGFTYSLLL